MEVIANNHSKRYPIELTYRETVNKTVSFVFSLENAKKLLSDLDAAIKEIEEQNDRRRKKEALQTSIPELRPKFKVGDIIAHNFRKRYPIWYEPNCFIVSVDEKGYNLKDGGFIGFGVQDDYFLVGRFNPNPTDSDAVPVRFEEEDGEKYPFVSYKGLLQKPWEWGEEETKVLDSIIDDYEKSAKSFCGYDGKIGLLRAIRDGKYDLSKQEWNEEDEWKRKELIQYLEEKGDYRTVWMTWLKSFSERFNSKKCNKEMDLDTKLQDRLEEISRNGLENAHTIDFSKEYENSKKILEKGSNSTEWSEEDNIGWDEAFACVTRAEKAAKNEEELQNAVTAEKWLKEIKFKYYVHPVKQEWSGRDEEILEFVLGLLDNLVWRKDWEISQAECLEWLVKSLNPTKQEWSEEDEKMRINILNALTPQLVYSVGKGTCTGTSTYKYDDEIKWLKSLRPSWKPNEEQKEALEYVIRDYREDGCNATANYLQEILDHLKNM